MTACVECGRELPPPAGTGRPAVYCGTQCRRAVEHRIARARRLCERLELRLVDVRVQVAEKGGRRRAPKRLEDKLHALEQELRAAEARVHDLLAIVSPRP